MSREYQLLKVPLGMFCYRFTAECCAGHDKRTQYEPSVDIRAHFGADRAEDS